MSPMNPRLLRPTPSGRFDPRRLANLAAWYDASDLSTLAQNSDGTAAAAQEDDPVGFLRDKGPNGHHMTQSTNNNRPLLKLAAQNARAALLFDGVDDFLLNTARFLNGSPASCAFVAQRQTDNPLSTSSQIAAVCSSGRLGGAGETTFAATLRSTFGTPANLLRVAGSAARRNGNAALDTGSAPTDFMIGTGAFPGNVNAQTANDGVSLGAARDGNGNMGATSALNFRLNGRIGEVILYNRELSLAEREALESYLSVKWGITLT
jgi:hypothetical protein